MTAWKYYKYIFLIMMRFLLMDNDATYTSCRWCHWHLWICVVHYVLITVRSCHVWFMHGASVVFNLQEVLENVCCLKRFNMLQQLKLQVTALDLSVKSAICLHRKYDPGWSRAVLYPNKNKYSSGSDVVVRLFPYESSLRPRICSFLE